MQGYEKELAIIQDLQKTVMGCKRSTEEAAARLQVLEDPENIYCHPGFQEHLDLKKEAASLAGQLRALSWVLLALRVEERNYI